MSEREAMDYDVVIVGAALPGCPLRSGSSKAIRISVSVCSKKAARSAHIFFLGR
jgi:hypothetical protein